MPAKAKAIELTVEEAILVGTWLKNGAERLQDSVSYLSRESDFNSETVQRLKALYSTLDDIGDRLLRLHIPNEE